MGKKYSPRSKPEKSQTGVSFTQYGALVGGVLTLGVAISGSPVMAQEAQSNQASEAAKKADPTKKADQSKKAEPAKKDKAAAATNKSPSTGDAANKKAPAGATAGKTAPANTATNQTKTPATAQPSTAGGTVTPTSGAVAVVAAPGEASATIQDVVVTARLREEKVEDVPIPVTAVTGDDLDKEHQETVRDFAQTSPALTVNAPNARQTSIAIRGVGKSIANEALEPSVGVIVDGVFLALPGQTWGDFADLERIEVIRGPQGTLLGKNTTLGVLNITSKAPSFTPEQEIEITVGNRDLLIAKATSTGALIDGILAYRASVYYDFQDPLLKNLDPGAGDVNGAADRWGGRFQFLYTPNSDFTNRTIIEHSESHERNAAFVAVEDPQDYTDNGAPRANHTNANPELWTDDYTSRLARFGYTPTFNPFSTVDLNQQRGTYVEQSGISTQSDLKLDGGYVLTSISALKNYHFDALNDGDFTGLPIAVSGYLTDAWAGSEELRLASPRNQDILGQKFDWQTGLYGLRSETSSDNRTIFGADAGEFYAPASVFYNPAFNTTVGKEAIAAYLNDVFVHQIEHPETISLAAYGQTTWHVTDQADLTLGIRNTYEDKSNWTEKYDTGGESLAAFGALAPTLTALRNAYSSLFTLNGVPVTSGGKVITGPFPGSDIYADSVSYLINPSYKITNDILAYASFGHGEKSGAVQFNQLDGEPENVRPERTDDYELGVKARLFDNALTINPNLYWTEIADYQTTLAEYSPATGGYITYLGNVPGVRIRGAELEGNYKTLVEGLKLTFSGSYNDGVFTNYKNGLCPGDLSYATTQTCDYTGKAFTGTSRWVGNIGFDYSHPVFDTYVAYAFVSETYRTGTNYSYSVDTWQPAYSITNAGIGIRPDKGPWDLSLWAKNLFDTHYYTGLAPVSQYQPVLGIPGDPLQVGLTFKTKL